jgi:Flp pilus assembly protein TadG
MSSLWHRILHGTRDQRGATAAEFAILCPVFCMMIFGVIEISRMMYMGASVQWAVDRAARMVIVDPDVSDSDLEAAVTQYLVAAGSPTVAINTEEEDFGGVPVIRLSAHYDHAVYGPFITGWTVGFDFETLVPRPDA